MTKMTIRIGSFETNSSSHHTLSLGDRAKTYQGELGLSGSKYELEFGEFFSRYGESISTVPEKLKYLCTVIANSDSVYQPEKLRNYEELWQCEKFMDVRKAVKDYSGVELVFPKFDENEDRYVDLGSLEDRNDIMNVYMVLHDEAFRRAIIDFLFGTTEVNMEEG